MQKKIIYKLWSKVGSNIYGINNYERTLKEHDYLYLVYFKIYIGYLFSIYK